MTYGNGSTDSLMTYSYNLSGALIEQQYPSGRKVQNTIDANGDLEMVRSRKNASSGYWAYANNFTYNAAGAVTSMQLGNGRWESTTFNSRLQPTQIALGSTPGATNLLDLDYAYGTTANNGNVLSHTVTVASVGATNGFSAVQTFNYDSLNRLKDATENVTPAGGSASQSWKQTFTFDRYGNRRFDEANTTMPASFANPAMTNPTISPNTNKLTSTGYSFDAAGNTTRDAQDRKFTYDGENKQVKVETLNGETVDGTVGEYFYDGNGKRVKKRAYSSNILSEETVFVYDAGGKLVVEYSTVVAPTNDAKVAYTTSDHLGSPRINTDANGAVTARHDYHPFGEEIATSQRTAGLSYRDDSVRKQFTGYERDNESNLDFAGARYYNSQHGRFTGPDDFLNDTHVSEPQSWNLYVYVRNNPLNYVDPFVEEVYSTNLSDEEKKKLLDDWRNKTGYKNIYFDKDNKLVIDTKAGFDGGSKSARQLLSDAVDSTEKRFNLTSVDSKDVAFAQVDAGTITQDSSGKKVGPTVFKVNLDFKDFNQFRGSGKDAVAAFSIGIAAFHEIAHKLYKEIGDNPNSDTDPGPVENKYINPIRRELGLAERVYYSAKTTPAALKSFFPNGGNQLQFRLNKKDKILRWQTDQVGGKVQ